MIRVPHVPLMSLVAAATLGTSELLGQALTVRAGAAHIGNELVGGVLGGGLLASFPVGSSDTRILIGAEYLAGTSSRIGVPCGGLIAPRTCPPEPLQAWAASASGLVGIRVPAWQGRRVTVSLGGDLGISRVRSRTRGQASGREITAAKAMWRGDLVGEAEWHPRARRGLGLVGGVAVGGLAPVSRDVVADGYTPFDRTARALRGWLGVTWRSGRL